MNDGKKEYKESKPSFCMQIYKQIQNKKVNKRDKEERDGKGKRRERKPKRSWNKSTIIWIRNQVRSKIDIQNDSSKSFSIDPSHVDRWKSNGQLRQWDQMMMKPMIGLRQLISTTKLITGTAKYAKIILWRNLSDSQSIGVWFRFNFILYFEICFIFTFFSFILFFDFISLRLALLFFIAKISIGWVAIFWLPTEEAQAESEVETRISKFEVYSFRCSDMLRTSARTSD